MEIAGGGGDRKAARAVRSLMNMTRIVAARNIALDLRGNSVFLGDLHCAVDKIAVVDRGTVHKRNNTAAADLSHSRVLGNVGKVSDRGGLKDDGVIGSEAVSRCGCARNADLLANGERANEVREAVIRTGFTVEKEIKENDWVGMLVRI